MKYSVLPTALLLGLAQFVLTQPIFAQQPKELEDVVVTADRVARTADETLAPVTVITRQDIERLQAQSVQDLLRGLPGVSIANNGGPGKSTSIFLRGTNSDHVLILIDGMRIGSATLGTTPLQDIPVEQIERIEIVRGPRASLYGSEAIGGVVQIFTRKGSKRFQPSFSFGGGSRSTFEAAANLSGGQEDAWFNFGMSANDTHGINALNSTPPEPDRDGYRNQSYSARAGYQFTPQLSTDLQMLIVNSHNKYDGFTNESDASTQTVSAVVSYSPYVSWHNTVRLGESRDESEDFKNGVFNSRFNTRRNTASWQNDIELSKDHLLTAGVDYLREEIDTTEDFPVKSRNNKALFGQHLANFGSVDTQLSLRADDNEQFGTHSTGNVAIGYTVTPALRLTTSYGTAFRAPTFNALYYPGFGNALLRPETSRSFDLGANGTYGQAKWSLSAYQTYIKDLIVFTPSVTNINQARIRGVEGTIQARIRDTDLGLNITIINPENRSSGPSHDNTLSRRARQTARFDIDRKLGAWSFGSSLLAVGKRYDDLANTRKLGGYSTVDVRAEVKFNPQWRLQARIENLFDKRYETAYFYNQPGFGAFLTLRYQAK